MQGIILKKELGGYELWRGKKGWIIRHPVRARGNQQAVEQLLDALLAAEQERVIEERGGEELTTFGLLIPRAEVVLKGEKKEEAVLVGEQNPTQTAVFAMRKGDERVFLLSFSYWFVIDKGLYDLRDKTILSFFPDKVKELEVRYRSNRLRLKKEGEEWHMTFPVVARADSNAIGEFLDGLSNGRVMEFVNEPPGDLRPYGLHPPVAEVWIGEEGNKGIRFGARTRDEKGIYAQMIGGKDVFVVDERLFARVPQKAFDWRVKDIFSFEKDKVTKVAFHYGGKEVVCEKTDSDQWEITFPHRIRADTYKVNNFLWEIEEIVVEGFLSYKKSHAMVYGFRPPQGMVALWVQGEEQPTTLIIGKSLPGRADRVYARKKGEREVYQVASSSLKVLNKAIKDFRYRKLFSFDKGKVDEIEASSPDMKILLVKKGAQWRMKIPKREMEEWRITFFIWSLEDLEYADELEGFLRSLRI